MRSFAIAALLLTAGLLTAGLADAQAQTKPVLPVGPVPSGGLRPSNPVDGVANPKRGVLYIPQFAPPGTQVPGGPPASNVPTLITPTVLGINR